MAKPILTPFADAVYTQLQPLAFGDSDANEWALATYVQALATMFDFWDNLAHGEVPWSKLLDIDAAPVEVLAYLGQFLGVSVDNSLSENARRQQIRDREGWDRGTLKALRSAILRTGILTGTKSVVIRERWTDAYNFEVLTYPSESGINQRMDYAGLLVANPTYKLLYGNYDSYYNLYIASLGVPIPIYKAIEVNKPASLTFTYVVAYPNDYWGMWADFLQYQTIYNQFPSYKELYGYTTLTGSPGVYLTLTSEIYYLSVYEDHQMYGDLLTTYATY